VSHSCWISVESKGGALLAEEVALAVEDVEDEGSAVIAEGPAVDRIALDAGIAEAGVVVVVERCLEK